MNTTTFRLKPRLQAASIHFLFSIIIFVTLLWILLTLWYPEPFFTASGGWQGLKLVAMVDIVLGPLIMFAIFDRSKGDRKLYTDIVIIVTLQISALVWGVVQVHGQRPIAATFWEDRFYVVTAAELTPEQQATLSSYGDRFPVMTYAQDPPDIAGKEEMLQRMQTLRQAPYTFTDYYRPYRENLETIRRFKTNMKEVSTHNREMSEAYQQLLQEQQLGPEDHFVIPLISKYHNILIVLDHQGAILGYIDAPYKPMKKR
ncbi:MAG: hypothetical protein HQL48_10970 [Gammaproteobacteria bacterium]|nr:hypothetical protein [Gammaproteobacteria bacterium]